jgi:fermentation-respiration switch protein FrsA (DUF1100 family)
LNRIVARTAGTTRTGDVGLGDRFRGETVLNTFQTRRIFPGSLTQGTPQSAVEPRQGVELVRLSTPSGAAVAAAFGPSLMTDGESDPHAVARPTLLYFYGNGWCLREAVAEDLDRFRRLGVNVMIPDYLGYGMSEGTPSEAGCYETADACLDHLLCRPDVDPGTIVAVGRSLGGAVAIDLASRRKVAGLIAFCTFTRMVAMARRRFPYLPASLLLNHRFESIGKMGRVTCPVLLGHAGNDQVVPPRMSAELAAAVPAGVPVTTFSVALAGHGDFYEVGEAQILHAMRGFLAGVSGAAAAA